MMGANPGRGRIALVLLLFFLLALAGGVISMMMGSVEIPLQEILGALAGAGGTHAQILWNIRLPRTLVGSDHRVLLPAAALLGAATLLYSDTFARVAFAPVELPVGIIMAALGAPFFLFLLRRQL